MINIEEIYYLEKTKEVFERDRILRILPGEDNLYANIKKVWRYFGNENKRVKSIGCPDVQDVEGIIEYITYLSRSGCNEIYFDLKELKIYINGIKSGILIKGENGQELIDLDITVERLLHEMGLVKRLIKE